MVIRSAACAFHIATAAMHARKRHHGTPASTSAFRACTRTRSEYVHTHLHALTIRLLPHVVQHIVKPRSNPIEMHA